MDENLIRYRKDLNLLFFDFETYNLCLSFEKNKVFQASMVYREAVKPDKDVDILIKYPGDKFDIGEGAAKITGYWSKKIKRYGYKTLHERRMSHGVDFPEAFETIESYMEKSHYIISHNGLGFDIPLLSEMYRLNDKSCRHLLGKFIDTNCLEKAIQLGFRKEPQDSLIEFQYKLYHKKAKGVKTNQLACCKKYGIEVDENQLHESLYDTQINAKIFEKIIWQLEI